MNKISSIEINGLKSYVSETSIKLSNMNVLSGINSVGKSTCIQSILLLRLLFENSRNGSDGISEAFLNSEKYGLELGTYQKIITGNNTFFELGINENKTKIEMKSGDSLKIQADLKSLLLETEINIFNSDFFYLSAERNGPRDFQKVDSLGVNNCGIRGENSFHILNKFSDKIVDTELIFPGTEAKADMTLKKQVEKWMNSFFNGIEFNSTLDSALRLVKLEFKQKEHDMEYVSLNNVGFGLSYVLPIILTCLNSQSDALIIIENPEAHLHPKGQSSLGKFLAQVALTNRQVIIETHSEHIINGIRLGFLEHKEAPDKLSINFFSIRNGETDVERIPLNARMDLLKWPEDFFDQQEIDLKNIREVRRQNE